MKDSATTATWVLVADASGASTFSYVYKREPWKLVERLDSEGDGAAKTADFGPKSSGHKGALHAHGASSPKEAQERKLAHELAHALERGLADHAFHALVLVAPPKLLGELRQNLSRGLAAKIVAEVPKDYLGLTSKEIAEDLRPLLPSELQAVGSPARHHSP